MRLSAGLAAAIDTKSVVSKCVMPTMAPVETTVSWFSCIVVAHDSIPVDLSLSYMTICQRSHYMTKRYQ